MRRLDNIILAITSTLMSMCISGIRVWMITNKSTIQNHNIIFPISTFETKVISDLSISVGVGNILASSNVKDLSVVLDQYLTFHDHINGICKYTHFHLRNFGRNRNLLTCDATAQLIHALITTRLDICNIILYNLKNYNIEILQRMQNQTSRMLTHNPWHNHITPVLRELYWLKIHDIILNLYF